jgi:CarD family transcriptional regulator
LLAIKNDLNLDADVSRLLQFYEIKHKNSQQSQNKRVNLSLFCGIFNGGKIVGFEIGQQVIYPNHGVGTIEKIASKQFGANALAMYELRLFFNNSTVLVPVQNADEIGLRLPITVGDCKTLLNFLSDDFANIPNDWKVRFRDYSEKVKRGEVFEVADVLKKLTYLSRLKPLSFREQRLWEKSRYLVISELAAVCRQSECQVEKAVDDAISASIAKHQKSGAPIGAAVATVH